MLSRDKYTCYYCGNPGETIDHVIPKSKGGHSTPLNCVCACKRCNMQKGDKSAHDFIKTSLKKGKRRMVEAKLIWLDVLKRIKDSGRISGPSFETWFSETSATFDNDMLVIWTNSKMAKEWLYQRYAKIILEVVEEVTGRDDIKIGFRSNNTFTPEQNNRIKMFD